MGVRCFPISASAAVSHSSSRSRVTSLRTNARTTASIDICIMFVPEWVEFLFGLTRALLTRNLGVARDAFGNLIQANLTVLLTLTLLAHQMLLSIDAVVRALVRRLVTRERLLEWETAAEAEMGKQ